MTIRITICDDEQAQRECLAVFIREWARSRNAAVHITEYESAEGLLFEREDTGDADVLFLDIQMKEMDGVTLARKIRAANKEIQIIFITGYMEYIADGYEVEALHYLLKPVTGEKLSAVLDRAAQKLNRNAKALLIKHDGGTVRLPLYEIRYVEVLKNYATIHAIESYTVKKTLGELERELDDGFFRAGRSYIVNLKYIRKVTKTEVFLSDGASVPLSRGLYDALNRAMIERL
jgi:DNA-binding LytR/AlgR family response regulator